MEKKSTDNSWSQFYPVFISSTSPLKKTRSLARLKINVFV